MKEIKKAIFRVTREEYNTHVDYLMEKSIKATDKSLEDYVNDKLEEVISTCVYHIKNHLDKHPKHYLYTRPELISVIQDRLEDKHKDKIKNANNDKLGDKDFSFYNDCYYIRLCAEYFDGSRDDHAIYLNKNELTDFNNQYIKMESYADYLSRQKDYKSYAQYIKKLIIAIKFNKLTYSAYATLQKKIEPKYLESERQKLQEFILSLVYHTENFDEDQRIIMISEREETPHEITFESLGINKINLTKTGNHSGLCMYFESSKNFYLILLKACEKAIYMDQPDRIKRFKDEIYVLSKDAEPVEVEDFEISKDGFEVIEMMNIGDTITIEPKAKVIEKTKRNKFTYLFYLSLAVCLLSVLLVLYAGLTKPTISICIQAILFAVINYSLSRPPKVKSEDVEMDLTRIDPKDFQ